MSRKRTGAVDYRPNPEAPGTSCWFARYTRGDRVRTAWEPLDPSIGEHDVEGARKCAAEYAATAKASTKDGKGESVEKYAGRWLKARPPKTAKDNGSHLTHHILPVIGQTSILALTSKHGDELVAALDAKIAAGTMSDKSARNVWGTLRGYFHRPRVTRRGCNRDGARRARERPRCDHAPAAAERRAAAGRAPDAGAPGCRTARIRRRDFAGASRPG
jgi:hypothetical protein